MRWSNWVQLFLGLWVVFSPWVLGFSEINLARWSNLIFGALIAIFALWALFGDNTDDSSL